MYQLEHPWLLVLLPLPLLVWLLLKPYREESASVRLPFFGQVAGATGLQPSPGAVVPRSNWLQWLVAPLAWALVVLALARPQFVEPPVEKVQPARDLLLAIDLSQSMDSRDFRSPDGHVITRVAAVKQVVGDFIARRTGDRIGLIVFGDAPYPQAPFTMDHALVQQMVGEALPGMAGPRTSLGDAIGLAIKMFEASHAQQKVLIVLTDGNDTASKMPPERAAEIAQDRGVIVHTVAIGDPNAHGEDKVDLETLKRVAASTNGRAFFGADQKQLQAIYAELDRITPHNQKVYSWRPKRELFMWPLGAAVLLVIAYQLVMAVTSTLLQGWRGLADRREQRARGEAARAKTEGA